MNKESTAIPNELRISQPQTFREVVLKTIQTEFGCKRGKVKTLARAAKASPKSAENWLAGASIPAGDNFANLLVDSLTLLDAVTEWADAERRRKSPK